jgi:sugar O-acyltransferase (sialic acid O-acetyltransferase NeuD family)
MTGRPLVLVGAGGHARETAMSFLAARPERDFLGFLDDRATGMTPEGWPILGRIDAWTSHRAAAFLVAVNDPRIRRRIVAAMRRQGEPDWHVHVHPGLVVHPSCRIGPGSVVLPGACLTVSVTLGEFTIVNRGVQLGHDVRVGAFTSVNPGAIVSGCVTVGDGVEVGSAASVRQGLGIGDGATLGMGAVAVKDVPANAVAIGNPARIVRENDPW